MKKFESLGELNGVEFTAQELIGASLLLCHYCNQTWCEECEFFDNEYGCSLEYEPCKWQVYDKPKVTVITKFAKYNLSVVDERNANDNICD